MMKMNMTQKMMVSSVFIWRRMMERRGVDDRATIDTIKREGLDLEHKDIMATTKVWFRKWSVSSTKKSYWV